MSRRRPALGLLLAVTLAGCGGGGSGDDAVVIDAAHATDARPTADAFDFGARPYDLFVPTGYVAGTAVPLVVLLHGYGASGAAQESYFMLQPVAEAQTFLYATPDGTVDTSSSQFWNATDACCDFNHTGIDDVTYLRALVDDVAAHYTVDPRRIFFIGHSNGGFMSHRMACEASDRIAAVISLAGATWNDPTRCSPSEPISVVEVHGTADTVVAYTGGVFGGAAFPSAPTTVATWEGKNGCTGEAVDPTHIDLAGDVAGPETTITRATGCPAGGAVELWTVEGGSHIPGLQPTWGETVWAFFAAHAKP